MIKHSTTPASTRYALAIVTAMTLCIAGTGLTPANAATPEKEAVATTAEDTTVTSETTAGPVGLTLPGTLTNQPQISLAEVPEEYLETTQETPLASTTLAHGAVSSYQTEDGVQTLIRIDSAQAAKEYRFPLSLPAGATVELVENGSILIKDAQGETLGGYKTPWAVDANGKHVPTRFRLEDDTLIQTVGFTPETVFPVVADPHLWQMGISAAAAGAVAGAAMAIPGGGPFVAAAAGCTAGAMNAMFDGRDFWGVFWGCIGTGGLGGITQSVRFIVVKVFAKFRR